MEQNVPDCRRLPPEIDAQIMRLSDAFTVAKNAGDLAECERILLAEFELLPTPKTIWADYMSLIHCIIDFYRESNQAQRALPWLELWDRYPGSYAAVARDRVAGTLLFDLGDLKAAHVRLRAVYDEIRARGFRGLDPKYLAFAQSDGSAAAAREASLTKGAGEGLKPEEVLDQAVTLLDSGTELMGAKCWKEAAAAFERGIRLLPEPVDEWDIALPLYTGLGDAYFHAGQWLDCAAAMCDAMNCGEGFADPFVNLRLGQALFELGDHDKAMNALCAAYMLEGPEFFEGSDPKYFAALKKVIKDPVE